MAFIQDIEINLSNPVSALEEQDFNILAVVSGDTEKEPEYITGVNDVISLGYGIGSNAYKMASAVFSQEIKPSLILIAQKPDTQTYTNYLSELLLRFSSFWCVVIESRLESDLNETGDWCNANDRYFFGCTKGLSPALAEGNVVLTGGYDFASSPKSFIVKLNTSDNVEITLNAECLNTIQIVDHINTGLKNANLQTVIDGKLSGLWAYVKDTQYIGLKTIEKGASRAFSLSAGTDDALAVLGFGAGNYSGLDSPAARNIVNELYVIHDNEPYDYPECALAALGITKLKNEHVTLKFQKLSGQNAAAFDITELKKLRDNNFVVIQQQKGAIFTNEGIGTGGIYMDVIFGKYLLKDRLETAILFLLLDKDKVTPVQIEGVMREVFVRLGQKGFIKKVTTEEEIKNSDLGDYQYTLYVPQGFQDENEAAGRILSGITFSYTAGDSVHSLRINGKIIN